MYSRGIQQYNTRCEILNLSQFINIVRLARCVCNALLNLADNTAYIQSFRVYENNKNVDVAIN